MKAILFSSGDIYDYDYIDNYIKYKCNNYDVVICLDGGLRHCDRLNIIPNIIMGDFDSVNKDLLEKYKTLSEIMPFPPEKDYTDTELGVTYAIKKGATNITMFGATGTRLDHSLGNIQMLYKSLKSGVITKIVNENNIIEMINNKIILNGKSGDIVSLIPFVGSVKEVNTEGLKYPLYNENLELGNSRGISNEILEDTAVITVKEGYLIVILAKD